MAAMVVVGGGAARAISHANLIWRSNANQPCVLTASPGAQLCPRARSARTWSAHLLKRRGVQGQGDGRAEYARAAAGRLLGVAGVGRAVRAQEELGAATGGRRGDGLTVALTLEDR